MNFLSDLFKRKESISPTSDELTAKEKQLTFIKEALKPLLKAEGYRTFGNKWWKINEPFFNLIELQNFSWNLRNSVDFCFNFTTGFVKEIKNPDKPTIHDGIPYIRESYFNLNKNHHWPGTNGYHIDDTTDLIEFIEQATNDFKLLILPEFNKLTTEEAIIEFYADDFWGPRVKQSLKSGYTNTRLE